MDNIQSVHKGPHLYLVILFLLFVSRILAFNFMPMSVKIWRYRAIIIIIIIMTLSKNIFMKIGPRQFCKFKYHYNNKDNIDLDIR